MTANNEIDSRQSLLSTASPTFSSLTLTNPLTVGNGGSGKASNTAYAVQCGGTTSTGTTQSIASVGSSGQILTSNGASALPTFQTFNNGKVLQQVRTISSSTTSSATAFPSDNTIPQNTEGVELQTLSITPTSASSILLIEFYSFGFSNNDGTISVALFVDTTANALCSWTIGSITDAGTSEFGRCYNMVYYLSSGSTSARTYKIRAGSNIATFYSQRFSTSNLFATSRRMNLTITEYSS